MIQIVTRPPPAAIAPVSILPEHISPSAAKSYLGCSLRFYFERVIQLKKGTTAALHLGKAVHAALQAFHLARWREGDDSPDAVARAFDESFTRLEREEGPVRFTDEADRQKNRQAGLRVVAAYLDSPEVPQEKPRAVEVPLSEMIPGLAVPLTGTMDLVEHDYVPVDFKSAAAKPNPGHAVFEHEIQLVSYQLLLERAIGVTPRSLDLVFLVKTKAPKVIRIAMPPASRQRKERVIRLLATAVEGIAEGRFHPQPGMGCLSCRYRRECLAWNPRAA